MKPHEIERLSFEIIDREAGNHGFTADQWTVVRRMIHTSADFDYIDTTRFTPNALEKGIEALKSGRKVVVDTNMVKVGIRKQAIEAFGGSVECFMTDSTVAENASKHGKTRARAAVDRAVEIMEDGIYVVGNAPTALMRLLKLIGEGTANPALIVGLPVGFVNAVESKNNSALHRMRIFPMQDEKEDPMLRQALLIH